MADDTKIDDGVSEDVTMTAETVTEDVSESVTEQIVDPVAEETAQPEVVQDGETAKATETENQENKSTSNSTEGELGLDENQRNIDNDKSQQESSNEQISKDETSDERETAGKGGEKLSDAQNDDGDKNRPTDGEDADVEDNEDEEDANAKNAPAGNAPADDVSKKNDKDSRKKERVSTGKSVQSSINVKIVRIRDLGEEGEDTKSEAKSYSSRRSERSTFMTTVADEVSVAPTFDEVQAELDRVLSRQTAEDGLQQSELPGRTATRNTPATPMTDYPESPTSLKFIRKVSIRAGTKLTLASIPSATKDTIYQRALALMDTRCSSHTRSIGEGTVTTDRLPLLPPASLPDHPYRHFPESFFYVTQQRPLPAAPVKAWRGYHGNVYFEPLTCRKIDTAPVHKDKSFYTSLVLKNRGTRSVTFSPKKEILSRHNYKRATTKRPGTRQMALLDKASVIQRMDENVQEDVRWISGLESVGSLRVGSPETSPRLSTERYDKMRICRGFVSHTNSPRFQTLPIVPLKGGRMTHPASKSHYFTTQYRGSSRQGLVNSRMAMSISPELYNYSPSAPLPSLEKIQASLQNVEKSREMVFSIPPYHPGLTTENPTPRSPKTDPRVHHTMEGDKNKKLQSY